MKDISNNRQPSFLLMKIDENEDKFWRLNFNIQQKTSDEEQFFECDFVPKDGGLKAETPTVDLFYDELIEFGLTKDQINEIYGSSI